MQTMSRPAAAIASASSSGVVLESPDHIVCTWQSSRSVPGPRGAARCGWRSTAEPGELVQLSVTLRS